MLLRRRMQIIMDNSWKLIFLCMLLLPTLNVLMSLVISLMSLKLYLPASSDCLRLLEHIYCTLHTVLSSTILKTRPSLLLPVCCSHMLKMSCKCCSPEKGSECAPKTSYVIFSLHATSRTRARGQDVFLGICFLAQ